MISSHHSGTTNGHEPNELTAALAYAGRGWPVLPCRQDKAPRTTHGFYDAATDPAVISGWWNKWPDALVGIRTGTASGLLVIDVDPRNGGDHSLVSLEQELGPLHPTLVVQTGGGGRHLYFTHSGATTLAHLGEGLDVKAEGGYVIAPPSITVGQYVAISAGDPSPLPPTWQEALVARARAQTMTEPNVEKVDPGVIARARRYLARMPAAISGQRGHDAAFTAALAMVKGYSLPSEQALALLLDQYNPRCQPPWAARELRHKVSQAAAARLPDGYILGRSNKRRRFNSTTQNVNYRLSKKELP